MTEVRARTGGTVEAYRDGTVIETMTKTTDVVGVHRAGHGLIVARGGDSVSFADFMPDGARGRRGTWRVSVEFTPEDR